MWSRGHPKEWNLIGTLSPCRTCRNPLWGGGFKISGRPDLNRGPPAPKAGALPSCATPRVSSESTCRQSGFTSRGVASDAAMAEIEPLRALRYDPAKTGGLQDVVAPPYDVIDDEQRAALEARSPYNIVRVDLPRGGEDRYELAAREFA